MTSQPKRLPGEKNPAPRADSVDQVARQAWMNEPNDLGGGGDFGIVRGFVSLLAWRKRRKAGSRRPSGPRNTLLGP
jgi:hypothetical protein